MTKKQQQFEQQIAALYEQHQQFIACLNNQAQHISKLTRIVVELYQKLNPEQPQIILTGITNEPKL